MQNSVGNFLFNTCKLLSHVLLASVVSEERSMALHVGLCLLAMHHFLLTVFQISVFFFFKFNNRMYSHGFFLGLSSLEFLQLHVYECFHQPNLGSFLSLFLQTLSAPISSSSSVFLMRLGILLLFHSFIFVFFFPEFVFVSIIFYHHI